MNLFPYGFSKDEVYENLGDVKDLEYFGIVIGSIIVVYFLVHLVHYIVFECVKKKEEVSSLVPLVAKSNASINRVMSFLHIILFLNGLSHFFHIGWLIEILWYPMWITLYLIKIFTEMYIIVISLFSISRYFIHYKLALPSVELSQIAVKSGIRMISSWIVLKDIVMFIWLLVVLEMKWNKTIGTILNYYYGIHLMFQLLLFISAFLQLPIICGSQKSEVEPILAEKMIYNQTLGIAFSKIIMIPGLLSLGFRGVNDDVLSGIFFVADLILLPIVVQFSEICYFRKMSVQATEREDIQLNPV